MKKLGTIFVLIVISAFIFTSFSQSPESVVRDFFSNVENNISANRNLFASPSATVMVYGKNGMIREDAYMTAEQWIQGAESGKRWRHVIDNLETLNSDGNIAAVVVTGHTESWRTDFNTVITLSLINGGWKIVSYMQENHQ
jgi:hypothetical protein